MIPVGYPYDYPVGFIRSCMTNSSKFVPWYGWHGASNGCYPGVLGCGAVRVTTRQPCQSTESSPCCLSQSSSMCSW
ncbi:hypothetical protein PHET_01477 [Paragonimus heterotremus]|uniref:Uncharacterized protein n=1 Tax=Paragonimus heterotremus TaxID=100268 RepID=A0A8J4T3R4_9TREM|nr:hypothetical protein PHET_01477 [Paragonimus heterotremus]